MGMRKGHIVKPLADRFWEKVLKTDTCWLWTGSRNEHGYGKMKVGYKNYQRAHRVAWDLLVGPIPAGLFLLHSCDTPACVNPKHLFLGTQADNMQDATNKNRCPKGERASWSKLTETQVVAIRSDPRLQDIIAQEYGLCQQSVSLIKRRITWKHLP